MYHILLILIFPISFIFIGLGALVFALLSAAIEWLITRKCPEPKQPQGDIVVAIKKLCGLNAATYYLSQIILLLASFHTDIFHPLCHLDMVPADGYGNKFLYLVFSVALYIGFEFLFGRKLLRSRKIMFIANLIICAATLAIVLPK